jgi:hypothetical protein
MTLHLKLNDKTILLPAELISLLQQNHDTPAQGVASLALQAEIVREGAAFCVMVLDILQHTSELTNQHAMQREIARRALLRASQIAACLRLISEALFNENLTSENEISNGQGRAEERRFSPVLEEKEAAMIAETLMDLPSRLHAMEFLGRQIQGFLKGEGAIAEAAHASAEPMKISERVARLREGGRYPAGGQRFALLAAALATRPALLPRKLSVELAASPVLAHQREHCAA